MEHLRSTPLATYTITAYKHEEITATACRLGLITDLLKTTNDVDHTLLASYTRVTRCMAHNSIARFLHDRGVDSACKVVPRVPSHLRSASQSVVKACDALQRHRGSSEKQERPHNNVLVCYGSSRPGSHASTGHVQLPQDGAN